MRATALSYVCYKSLVRSTYIFYVPSTGPGSAKEVDSSQFNATELAIGLQTETEVFGFDRESRPVERSPSPVYDRVSTLQEHGKSSVRGT